MQYITRRGNITNFWNWAISLLNRIFVGCARANTDRFFQIADKYSSVAPFVPYEQIFTEFQRSFYNHSFRRRNLKEFPTTETELKDMATPAMIGLKRMPKNG